MRHHIVKLSAALGLALFAMPAMAQFKVNASFRNTTETGWTITGTNNTGNNDSGILTGGYGLIADGNNTNDAVGSGFLRLTTDSANQVASARYTGGTLPSAQGVIADFDYVIWSGTGADGISFYLYDSTQTMAGAIAGAGLGYCWGAGSYLGIGIDEFGNFSSNSTGAAWCNSAGPGSAADNVVVRGPLANNNIYVGGAAAPGGIDVPTVSVRPASDHARIIMVPNGSGGFRVSVALSQNGGALTTVLNNLNFPYAPPANLRMGFGGSTGGLNNIHEVQNATAAAPADIQVAKTVSAASLFRGQTVSYTMTVTNADINPVDAGNQAPSIDAANAPDITDTLPASITGATWTCSATAGSTCPAASGSGNIASAGGYTLAPGGVLTFTITGTVAASATCGGTVTNTATADFSATDGFTDINTANNTASANFTVSCADLSITKTDGQTQYTPGQALSYTVVASNAGPTAVTNAVFTDPAIANYTVSGVTCGGVTGGATCPAVAATTVALMQGSGIVVPSLPSGGSVTFTITGTVAAGASGNLANTANIAMPGTALDTNTANNTATDTDTIRAALTLAKTWSNAIINDAVTVSISPVPAVGANLNSVANTANETDTGATPFRVDAGTTYTITETFSVGSAANYTPSLVCTGNSGTGAAFSYTAGATSGTITVGDTATAIACTFTNTRKSTTFRLAKAWGANAIAGNVASIGATTGLTNNTTAFTSTASTNTNGATVTVFAGETATLPAETFTTGTLANYTTALACDNGVTPSGSNGQASNTVAIPNNVAVLITCTYTNNRKSATLTLQKQWNTAVVNDTATVTVSRSATVIDTLNSVANTPTELDTDATPTAVFAGEALTLAETLGGTGAYNSALACTGGGTLAGSTVTVDSSGTAVTCTYTNTRQSADLRLTKTNTPGLNGEVDQAADTVVSGATTSYTITVTNLGPDGANGAVVTDPAPTNLTCSTATCTAAGGATCPVPSGAALVTALQGAGATVPTLPNGGSVTITMTCTVN